ncbi:MAG TPA: CocE/NonD family hydrolase [Streptosporangiaceae bacterium]|nr:CocE/NonD family hydrolase [Streptosporangiaceae bacterium]
MRQSTDRRTPRPVGPAAAALSKMLSRAWSLPPQRNFVAIERNVQLPMSDGTVLLADHYVPITSQPAATVLVRCPYGRGAPFSLLQAQLVAERGFHVLLQSCRGTFGSGGQFEPMRREASDGQDTVAWLRGQSWFDGRLATFGASYLGFVQWALALDPPSELVAAVVVVGPHDFSRTAYRNGAFDLYNFLSWSDLIVHQERVNPVSGIVRNLTADRRLRPALDRAPVTEGARDLLGTAAPWFETWLEHPQLTDPFWTPLQCGAALDRISVPTLLIGGWQDLFLEQTIEQFGALAERGVPTRMLIGAWTHLDTATRAGPAFAEGLAWLERHAGQVPGEPATGHSVRIWVGGAREWRDLATWPPPAQAPRRWYLGSDGTLSSKEPADGASVPPASFRYDPADPTPSVGGAILALNAGVRDNRAVEQRPDVLVFSSEPLDEPVEVIGDVSAEVHVTRDNPNADLFVRLCDVDPPGDATSRSRNVCDGIVRLTDADPLSGTVRVSLIGAAHRFGRGHRLRVQVAGGAHPRFARNPGNGQVDAPARDFVATRYEIGLSAANLSALVVSQTAGKAAAHA